MQTIAQQTMSLDQAERRIRDAIVKRDAGKLTRIANQLRAAKWAGRGDVDRIDRLIRNAREAKARIEVQQRAREQDDDGSRDGG